MNAMLKTLGAITAVIAFALPATAEQFVLKLENPLGEINPRVQETLKVQEVERLKADGVNFVILDAQSKAHLEAFLYSQAVTPLAISKVDFLNSPIVGGGVAASPNANAGHQTFVIERPIPGVGSFPLEKKEAISRASNAAIEELNGNVEWVHSYLTDVGTYCVYRAVDEDQIAAHARLSGAPLGPITAVEHVLPE